MYSRDEIYFHNFLTGMRTGNSVTLEQLSFGLCSADMLSRIEADERQPDKLMRDRLMERLGFENDGFEDFLPPEEYELWQNRDRLLRAVDKDGAAHFMENGSLLAIRRTATAEEKAAAAAFLSLCLSYEGQSLAAKDINFALSVRRDVLEEQIADMDEDAMPFAAGLGQITLVHYTHC